MIQFDLQQLFRKTFGIKAVPFRGLETRAFVPEGQAFEGLQVRRTRSVSTGLEGVQVILPLELDGFRFPIEPVISVRGRNKIIETEFDGNDAGTFKEMYSVGDYQVTIRGILLNDDPDFEQLPERDMRKLRAICEKQTHIKAVSELLAIYGIEYLAIKDYDFPGVPGELEMQAFELQCVSDKPYDLVLKPRL